MISPDHQLEAIRFLFWTIATAIGLIVTISILRAQGNGARTVMLAIIIPPTVAFASLAVGVCQKVAGLYATDWLIMPAFIVCAGWSFAYWKLKRLKKL